MVLVGGVVGGVLKTILECHNISTYNINGAYLFEVLQVTVLYIF